MKCARWISKSGANSHCYTFLLTQTISSLDFNFREVLPYAVLYLDLRSIGTVITLVESRSIDTVTTTV